MKAKDLTGLFEEVQVIFFAYFALVLFLYTSTNSDLSGLSDPVEVAVKSCFSLRLRRSGASEAMASTEDSSRDDGVQVLDGT